MSEVEADLSTAWAWFEKVEEKRQGNPYGALLDHAKAEMKVRLDGKTGLPSWHTLRPLEDAIAGAEARLSSPLPLRLRLRLFWFLVSRW